MKLKNILQIKHLSLKRLNMIWFILLNISRKGKAIETEQASGGLVVKNPPINADVGFIPRLRRSPGEGNGNPLQYSCLENLMDSWVSYSLWRHKESDMI